MVLGCFRKVGYTAIPYTAPWQNSDADSIQQALRQDDILETLRGLNGNAKQYFTDKNKLFATGQE